MEFDNPEEIRKWAEALIKTYKGTATKESPCDFCSSNHVIESARRANKTIGQWLYDLFKFGGSGCYQELCPAKLMSKKLPNQWMYDKHIPSTKK